MCQNRADWLLEGLESPFLMIRKRLYINSLRNTKGNLFGLKKVPSLSRLSGVPERSRGLVVAELTRPSQFETGGGDVAVSGQLAKALFQWRATSRRQAFSRTMSNVPA